MSTPESTSSRIFQTLKFWDSFPTHYQTMMVKLESEYSICATRMSLTVIFQMTVKSVSKMTKSQLPRITLNSMSPKTSKNVFERCFPSMHGHLRFCMDYRKLSSMTPKDTYPLPRMGECIDSLAEAHFFRTVDLNLGYWQMNIRKQDRQKQHFCTTLESSIM